MSAKDSEAVLTLCARMPAAGPEPLARAELDALARLLESHNLGLGDLLGFSWGDLGLLGCSESGARRLLGLLGRRGRLSSRLEAFSALGIGVATLKDAGYPERIARVLGPLRPPLFYHAGRLGLLEGRLMGFAGARDADAETLDFTRRTAAKTAARGLGVVSGGARGVDLTAEREALGRGVPVVEFLPGGLAARLRSGAVAEAVRGGRLLLLSAASPDAPFSAGEAMARNRLIYAQSEATLAVRARLGQGGTWSGAVDNLSHGWTLGLCWDNKAFEGNRRLVEMGAVPVDDRWDGGLESLERPRQLELF